MGIDFNYQQESRQYMLFTIVPTTAVSVFLLITFSFVDNFFYSYITKGQMLTTLMLLWDSIQTYISLLISTTFTIFLRTLYHRFKKLNSLLRWADIFLIILILLNWWWQYQSIWFRRIFSNRNSWNASDSIRRTDSIRCVKFVARQHLALTEVTTQLNFCYAFQVKFLFHLICHLIAFLLRTLPAYILYWI